MRYRIQGKIEKVRKTSDFFEKGIAFSVSVWYNMTRAKGYSSVGRAVVSKTTCPEFES